MLIQLKIPNFASARQVPNVTDGYPRAFVSVVAGVFAGGRQLCQDVASCHRCRDAISRKWRFPFDFGGI